MEAQPSLLTAKNLSHTYDYTLFEAVDLEVFPGDTIAIIGISGSGKSTLLHILSSLLEPDSGEVRLLNQTLSNLSTESLVKLRRNDIGIIFQFHYLLKGLSGLENIEIASLLAKEKLDHELYRRLKIDDVVDHKVTELSGGQQQRVSIARVLTKKPKLLFADEPTGNLDKQTASDVMKELFEYVQEHQAALIMVTHDEILAHQCSKVYKLENKMLQRVQ